MAGNHSDDLAAELARPLARARRARWLARLADVSILAAISGSALFAVIQFYGGDARWVIPAPLAIIAAATFWPWPTLAWIAQQLDSAGHTHDLITSAWSMRSDLNDPWHRALWSQAAASLYPLAKQKQWHWISPQWRISALLASAALCAIAGLMKTTPGGDGLPVAQSVSPIAWHGPAGDSATTHSWAAPPTAAPPSEDEPDENGRRVTEQSNARIQRPGDDATGGGRANSSAQTALRSSIDSLIDPPPLPTAGVSDNHRGGTRGENSGATSGNHAADGGVASAAQPTEMQPPSKLGMTGQAGAHAASAGALSERVSPAYRSLVQAYFSR